MKKSVLRNFTKFTGKHLCRVSFLIKLQALGLNFVKFLQNTSGGCFLTFWVNEAD